jgi:hypothetical protein
MINTFRQTVLKEDILIGEIMGIPLKIRQVIPGQIFINSIELIDKKDRGLYISSSFKMKNCAPALFLVIWGTARLDGFLSLKRSKKYAMEFLKKTGGK